MTSRTRRSNPELENAVEDSKRIIRSRGVDQSRSTGGEVSPLEQEAVMTRLLEEAVGELDCQVNTDTEPERNNVGTGHKKSTVPCSDVCDRIEQALNGTDSRIQDIVEKTVLNFIKKVDVDHNKSFLKNDLRRAMQPMLRSLMDDDNLREIIEAAVIQVATSNKKIDGIASALVVSDSLTTPVAKFVAARVHKEVSSLSQGSQVMEPPSLPPF